MCQHVMRTLHMQWFTYARDAGVHAHDGRPACVSTDPNLSPHPNPNQVCMLTMIDRRACPKYALHLRSHECYARRHGLQQRTEIVAPFAEPHPVRSAALARLPLTFRKIDAVAQALREDSAGWCAHREWVAWFDADLFIVDASRRLSSWLEPGDSGDGAGSLPMLVMTDHSAMLNNGAFLLRRSAWARQQFLPLWRNLSRSRTVHWPFTDNGAMLEAILRSFVPGYAPLSCSRSRHGHTTDHTAFLGCVNGALRQAFGPVRARGWRGARGLRLVAPQEGFNNHGCVDRGALANCSLLPDRAFPARQWGWRAEDMFAPSSSFALHTKYAFPLGAKAVSELTTC